MKQLKKLTWKQKQALAKEGKDPKLYAWSDKLQSFVRKEAVGDGEGNKDKAGNN